MVLGSPDVEGGALLDVELVEELLEDDELVLEVLVDEDDELVVGCEVLVDEDDELVVGCEVLVDEDDELVVGFEVLVDESVVLLVDVVVDPATHPATVFTFGVDAELPGVSLAPSWEIAPVTWAVAWIAPPETSCARTV